MTTKTDNYRELAQRIRNEVPEDEAIRTWIDAFHLRIADAIDALIKERDALRERIDNFRNSMDCRNRQWNKNNQTCLEVGAKGPYKCEQCELIEDDDRVALANAPTPNDNKENHEEGKKETHR